MKTPKWGYQFLQYFLRLWLPLVLLLVVVLWILFRTQADAALAILQANERQSIQMGKRSIDAALSVLVGDALYLAEHSSLQHWLDTHDSEAKSRLAHDFLAFAKRRPHYDQIRFLDEHGYERVRINFHDGHSFIELASLQDLSESPYVRNTLALDEKAVLISPFDLNIEQGVIEEPISPTIRFSAPVFGDDGQKRGLVVLNYQGYRLLNRLRAISEQSLGSLWLLNAAGYWLLGPDPGTEWGFMYQDRQAVRFEREFGEEIWSEIMQGPQLGQWEHEKGLFTYSKISPAEAQNNVNAEEERWVLISYVPPSVIAASTAENERNLVIAFIGLTFVLALVSGIIAYYIVRRRQAEAAVRASEIRFRGLLESAPDGIVIVDQRGVITLVNSQTEQWFGYTRDELLGNHIEQLIPERFRSGHVKVRDRYAGKPATRPMGAGLELFGRRKDGSEFPVEISLSPLQTDQGLLVTSIIRDITSRKQAEEMQRQVEMRYHGLVNNLPVGVYRNKPDEKGQFLEVNQAMVDIFEAESAEQLLTHHFRESYCDLAERNRFIGKVLHDGYVKGEEVRLKTLKGREFYAALSAVMKKNESGGIYFDGILEDISMRKESEHKIQQLNERLQARSKELETINRELEAFSYSVSHDLRAPLRAMDGFSRTLLDEYADHFDEKGRDRLRRIRAAAQRMGALIDDLLKLSRVSRTEIKREEVDLTQMANEVLQILQQDDPARTVCIQIQSGLMAYGDARLLRVVMDNLLGNAWKFTAHAQAASIEVGEELKGGQIVYFVRDNGIGFDMAYADKLFGAFQRLHDAAEFPGTGIGLATVQRVIHKHGGQIWAESAVNQGTTFYFILDEKESA